MALKLHNTLTRQKEEFRPLRGKKVTMYHCGPTVYWTQHIGNLRGMVMADLVVRTLKYLGYKVKLARNYTDVGHLTSDGDEGEDKMAKGVKREGLSPRQIAKKYIKIFEHDYRAVNVLEPDYKPRATKYIKEMIKLVQELIAKDYAYPTDLAIYFDVTKAANYGQLSGQGLADKLEGAGKGEVEDGQKKHPADFALWFFKAGRHQNALQFWPSPFQSPLVRRGIGFPGWHIECSAMARKLLGKTLDLHMGGIEHIAVHHTNEIAQSEAANGVKFVNYWLHNEHLLVNDRKMAKSEGTGYSLAEVEEKGFGPLALRFFFLQAHYRGKQNFTWEALGAAASGLQNIYNQVRELGGKKGKISIEFKNKFIEKISDDFNLPQALAVVAEMLKADLPAKDKLATILDFDKVLGLGLGKLKKEKLTIPAAVKQLAEDRLKARLVKDWARSDELRKKIGELGYTVEDDKDGYQIKKK
ncbi:MAG: cysteine--tRNA ligase [Patescibacteria group bacterium]|jgi:cysteinyl-tRNA synthetase